ncbi:MAG TPA: chromate transporter [Firmicutes bacterium]|nr:chromate transporter [Bacillota bacterium]
MRSKGEIELIIKLFTTFFLIGLFTFGGGYAMIPLIQKEVVITNHWLTMTEFIDVVGIAEVTPGPIAINSATFIGYKMAGIAGSALATLGVVLPSLIIIVVIASVFLKVEDNPYVKAAFSGMRPAVAALIASAAVNILPNSIVDVPTAAIAVVAFLLLRFTKVSPILLLLASGALGIVVF